MCQKRTNASTGATRKRAGDIEFAGHVRRNRIIAIMQVMRIEERR